MNNIEKLNADLTEQKKTTAELGKESFETVELTDDEKETLDRMRVESTVVAVETDVNGTKETATHDYMKNLNDRIATVTNTLGESEVLKVINNGDIQASKEELNKKVRENALVAMREIAIDKNLSEDDYLAINEKAMQALTEYFGMTKVNSDILAMKLQKMSMSTIASILPEEFIALYGTKADITGNSIKLKERIIAAIAYLAVTGPELDALNEYIDEENKLTMVSKRLLQCQVDFAEMLKSEESMSSLLEKAVTYSNPDTAIWQKYIKNPSMVSNMFAQTVVIYEEYEKEYRKLLEEYDEEASRNIILNEITECQTKAEVYKKVTELSLFRELFEIFVNRFATDKRRSKSALQREAIEAVERVKRSKQDVPFPGFVGNEFNGAQIYNNYITTFTKSVEAYNSAVDTVFQKDADINQETKADVVKIDGNVKIFADVVLIVMGRIMKRATRNISNKYDAIELDAYFRMFCRLGGDLFIMNDIWNIVKDFIKSCEDLAD